MTLYNEAIHLQQQVRKPDAEPLLAAFRLQLVLNNLEQAASLIERAQKLEPASRDVRFQLARLRMKNGDLPSAVREAESALKLPAANTPIVRSTSSSVQAYRALGQESAAARHALAIRALDEK